MIFLYICFYFPQPSAALSNATAQGEEGKHCGPNTYIFRNVCYCKRGFIGDSPILPRGCWKCDECHPAAVCAFPGRCVCSYGMRGDGLQCDPPIPDIKSTSVYGDYINAQYICAPDFEPYLVYCRFGTADIVNGIAFANRSVSCLVPQNTSGDTTVSLSFNRVNWSLSLHLSVPIRPKERVRECRGSYQIEFIEERIPMYLSRNTYIVVCVVIAINAAFYFSLPNRKCGKNAHMDEAVPLLHGGSGKTSETQSSSDTPAKKRMLPKN